MTAIELESFRGFAKAQRLDLDADVVLVRGDNGAGKTSLVDGILWLFTGDLPRLNERAKGHRRGPDSLVNLYSAQPARVRLTVALDGGQTIDFERCGNGVKSKLSAQHSAPATDSSAVLAGAMGGLTYQQLSEAVPTWGILQQHDLKAALSGGAIMHARMSSLLGLGRVTLFTESAARIAKSLHVDRKQLEAVRDQLRQRQQQAKHTLSTTKKAATESDAVSRLIGARLVEIRNNVGKAIVLADIPNDLEAVAASGRVVGELIERADALVRYQREALAVTASATEAADELQAELGRLRTHAEQAVQRAPLRVQLASAVLGLLADGCCPVCEQAIDEQSVRAHMSELLVNSEAEANAAEDIHRALAETQERLLRARHAEGVKSQALEAREGAIASLRQLLQSTSTVEVDEALLSHDQAGALVEVSEHLRASLRDLFVDAQRLDAGHVGRLQSEVGTLDEELAQVEHDLSSLKTRCEHADALDTAAKQAAERIVRRALARLEPSFAEVFDRLSPHPTFTELCARQDIYYKKNQIVPEVHDPGRGLSVNPEMIFSEGQLNVVALSYFLGLALNAGEGALPFLVLDDPLQTMDIVGVLGFADMCRRIREHRQLVVTTHDRRFAEVLARKLAPRESNCRTIVHEFDGWTRDGPRVSETESPFGGVVQLLDREAS